VFSQIPVQALTRLQTRLAPCNLPESFLAELLRRYTPVQYPRDSLILKHEASSDVVFLVLSGFVKIYLRGPTRRILFRLAGPGDIIGHAALPGDEPATQSMLEGCVLTDCTLALFTRQQVVRALESLDSKTVVGLLEQASVWWYSGVERYVTLMGLSFRERLQAVLADLGARFGVKDARGVLLIPEITHDDLAEMIGSSRPMVSRLLEEMADQGLVERSGRRQYVLLDGAASRLVGAYHSNRFRDRTAA
jgi:CRP/FNR family transcriptional regulator, cyclic AMP receptor protein